MGSRTATSRISISSTTQEVEEEEQEEEELEHQGPKSCRAAPCCGFIIAIACLGLAGCPGGSRSEFLGTVPPHVAKVFYSFVSCLAFGLELSQLSLLGSHSRMELSVNCQPCSRK